MIFKILIGYLKGYVNISVQGYYIQRFINACVSKGIFLWNLKPQKSTYVNVNVGISDFRKLKEISKKTGCKIKINDRKGMPFLINRYKKRKIFFILLIILLILLYIESKFIWNIEIEGVERIPQEEIITNLEEQGLKIRHNEVKNKC